MKDFLGRFIRPVLKETFYLLVKLGKRNKGEGKRLLITQMAGIGEVPLFSSTLEYFRKIYPTHHITLLVKDWHIPLVRRCPYVDEIMGYPEKEISKSLLARWRFCSRLVQSGFDTVIYPYKSRSSGTDELVFLTGARETISCDTDLRNSSARDRDKFNRRYSRLFPRKDNSMHELEFLRLFLEWLSNKRIEPLKTILWPDIDGNDGIREIETGLNAKLEGEKYVVFFPGSLSRLKMWPSGRYIEIGKMLLREYPEYKIVLCGGSKEIEIVKKISAKLDGERVIDACGKTDLVGLVEILRYAGLYLGSDTGALHISITL